MKVKIGVVFSGQGSQYSGMGKDLYDESLLSREVFDKAGQQIKDWCFEGDDQTLMQTHVTQPTIYTMTMAAFYALIEKINNEQLDDKIELTVFAGFSLGEYSALTAASAIKDVAVGIEIVSKRGALMQQAGLDEEGNAMGGMMAALGKREDIISVANEAREDGILEGVNFNSPIQTVVAGDKLALKRFRKLAKERKIRAIPLPVSTAFHSPMMKPAAKELKRILTQVDFAMPEVPVYTNVDADDIMKNYDGGSLSDYLADRLAEQAMSPVYWEDIIRNFEKAGVDVIVEVGPGKTLTSFNKAILPNMVSLNVSDIESLNDTIAELKNIINNVK